jgi:hypothetical protein
MTWQFRHKYSGVGGAWQELPTGLVDFESYTVEFREEPAFVPGYYRTVKNNLGQPLVHGDVRWWRFEPPKDRFVRVVVDDEG